MSDFSLTLVLRLKTSKIINDMAKVSRKSERKDVYDEAGNPPKLSGKLPAPTVLYCTSKAFGAGKRLT